MELKKAAAAKLINKNARYLSSIASTPKNFSRLKIGVNGYLIAQAVSSLAGVAYCVLRTSIIHTLKIRFDFVLLKTMLLYSTPLIFRQNLKTAS